MNPLTKEQLREKIREHFKSLPFRTLGSKWEDKFESELVDLILQDRKAYGRVGRFIDNHNVEYDDFTLGLKAGYVSRDGRIDNQQRGIESTFSVGMPVYGEKSGELLGRLNLHLYQHLNYTTKTVDGDDIPVEGWKIDGYEGKGEDIITYHQWRKRNQKENK